MRMPAEIDKLAQDVVAALKVGGLTIATAESCTGGLVAGALTSVSGSSDVVYGGYVTYANEAKSGMIGVERELIRKHGAVSEPVARAMAEGARKTSGAAVAIAVTGIAGPGGGTEGKPVGLVHFAFSSDKGTQHMERRYGDPGRQKVREETVRDALEFILSGLGAPQP
jgi:nicotinamide-nucleotide amidase